MFFSLEWLAQATIGRFRAVAFAHGLPTAGRIYWGNLRSLKDRLEAVENPCQGERVALIRVRSVLREINFSDAQFKAGGKFSNNEEAWDDLDRFVLEFDPATNEWIAVDVDEEVELPHLDDEVVNNGPYQTREENAVFIEAQSGSYPRLDFPVWYDDHDTREPEGWAEYLEPEGYGDYTDHMSRLGWRLHTDEHRWRETVKLHKTGVINVVMLALLAERFEDRGIDIGDPTILMNDGMPMTLRGWLDIYQGELDGLELDIVREEWGPVTAGQEQAVADHAAMMFERELLEHYKADPGQRPDWSAGKDANGEPRKWVARIWADAYYDLAKIRAIIAGYSEHDAKWAAFVAKAQAQRQRTPSREVTGVTTKGLRMGNHTTLQWSHVSNFYLAHISANDRESVLGKLRKAWTALTPQRQIIEKVAKAL